MPAANKNDGDAGANAGGEKAKQERRKIPGNLPYTSSHGALKRVLDKLPTTEKPSVFNMDFLATVLQVSGGSARPIPPILKAAGMLSGSGTPTELYAQFQTETGRSTAALQALRNAYGEIFRRNQFAHRADDKALTDIVVTVTGLPPKDGIVRAVVNTFQVFQGYAKDAREEPAPPADGPDRTPAATLPIAAGYTPSQSLGLVYNINVVLPETTNVEVYNAIFRSLRGNLLS